MRNVYSSDISRRRLIALGATMSLALTACGTSEPGATGDTAAALPSTDDWDAVVEAAKKEGQVSVFMSFIGTQVLEKWFEADYPGIDVKFTRVGTGDLISQIDQASAAGQQIADVVYHANADWFTERGSQGLVTSFPQLPEGKDWPQEARKDFYLAHVISRYGIAYNTAHGKQVSTMKEFFDVVGRDRVGVLDPSTAAVTADAIQSAAEQFEGDEFWKLLSGLNTSVIAGGNAELSLAAGEVDWVFPSNSGIAQNMAADGAPVAWTGPKGLSGYVYATGIPAKPPHPHAALVFMNWLMQKSTVDRMFKTFTQGSTSYLDVPSAGVPASDVRLTNLSDWPKDRWNEWLKTFNSATRH